MALGWRQFSLSPRETKTAWEAVLGICRSGKGPQGRASGRERVTRRGEGEARNQKVGTVKLEYYFGHQSRLLGSNLKPPANPRLFPAIRAIHQPGRGVG